MPDFSLAILYVDSPAASTSFYEDLLGLKPLETSPTFSMFAFKTGVMLGLWSRHTVSPSAVAAGGGGELAFTVADSAAVEQTYSDWVAKGLVIEQEPVELDFGRTFVALDPDGHRLRVFSAPAE